MRPSKIPVNKLYDKCFYTFLCLNPSFSFKIINHHFRLTVLSTVLITVQVISAAPTASYLPLTLDLQKWDVITLLMTVFVYLHCRFYRICSPCLSGVMSAPITKYRDGSVAFFVTHFCDNLECEPVFFVCFCDYILATVTEIQMLCMWRELFSSY